MAGEQNWDQFLQQSSALGILKPDAVYNVFGGGGGSGSGGGGSGDQGGASAGPSSAPAEPTDDVPAIRVVRTAHTSSGRSIFASDGYLTSYYPYADGGSFAMVDRRTSVPVSHGRAGSASSSSSSSSSSTSPPRCPPSGAAFVLCDVPPFRAAMPMRRTLTVDYVVVLAGEITLCLDGGDEKTVQAGEVVVQQGTHHAWVNRTAEPCRLLYVMLAGKKIILNNGSVLDKST